MLERWEVGYSGGGRWERWEVGYSLLQIKPSPRLDPPHLLVNATSLHLPCVIFIVWWNALMQ